MLTCLFQEREVGVLKFSVLGSCSVRLLSTGDKQIRYYEYINCHTIPRSASGTPFSIALASFSELAVAYA